MKTTRKSFTYYNKVRTVMIQEGNRQGRIMWMTKGEWTSVRFHMYGSKAEINFEDCESLNLGYNLIREFCNQLESMIGYNNETFTHYLK